MEQDYASLAPQDASPTDFYNNSLCPVNDTVCLDRVLANLTTTASSYTVGDLIYMILVGIVLGTIILVTILGNVFVIAAVILEKSLQSVANYLIISLAVADLMVACLVMPLSAVYVISRDWMLGPELCDMWTSSDVLCCTASILHLVAIATDRYWAVTDVDYIHARNRNKIRTMILCIWLAALTISLAPQFGWKDPDYTKRISEQKCLVSQDVGYQIFATCTTFYIPLVIILILYWRIFQAARSRIRRNVRKAVPLTPAEVNPDEGTTATRRRILPPRPFRIFKKGSKRSTDEAAASTSGLTEGRPSAADDIALQSAMSAQGASRDSEGHETTAFIISESPMVGQAEAVAGPSHAAPARATAGASSNIDASRGEEMVESHAAPARGRKAKKLAAKKSKALTPLQAQREKKESLEAKRERKAAKTLSIITGAFVICWLPFFVMAILTPFTGPVSDHLANFILWLGYFNSTLNPIIYTVFSPEFRQAFRRILSGQHGRVPRILGGRR